MEAVACWFMKDDTVRVEDSVEVGKPGKSDRFVNLASDEASNHNMVLEV